MCDPITLAGMALSAGGSLVSGREQAAAQQSAINAKNAALRAEMDRQKGFQDQAGRTFADTLGLFQPEAQVSQRADAIEARDAAVQPAVAAPIAPLPISASAPKLVKDTVQASGDKATADASARAPALAGISGFGDLFFNNDQNLAKSGAHLATTSNLSSASRGVNSVEQSVAFQNALNKQGGIGELVGLLGKGLFLGGATGSFGKLFGAGAPQSILPGGLVAKPSPIGTVFGGNTAPYTTGGLY